MKKIISAGVIFAVTIMAAAKDFNIADYYYAMGEDYFKQWNSEVQAKIDSDIEKYRKTDGVFALHVPGGTTVKVEQISHEFVFGANIFNFNQLGSQSNNNKYKAVWQELFNSATIPLYWSRHEYPRGIHHLHPTPDDNPKFWAECDEPEKQRFWRTPATLPILDFCDSNNVRKHAHPLVWGSNIILPEWFFTSIPQELLQSPDFQREFKYADPETKKIGSTSYWCLYGKLTPAEMAAKYPDFVQKVEDLFFQRAEWLCKTFASRMDSWDVVNESAIDNRELPYLPGGKKRLSPEHKICQSAYGAMPSDYVYRSFAIAGKLLSPATKLNINDYDLSDNYAEHISNLLVRGAKIDIIGMQMHIFQNQRIFDAANGREAKLDPAKWFGIMADFEKLNKPCHLSEITIMAPEKGKKGEAIQAVLAYNMYRLWFSSKNMMGITWWNVIDSTSPDEKLLSGILRRDLSKKPVYHALDDLINRQWKTRCTVKADENGKISFRGFRGTYRLSFTVSDGREIQSEVILK